MVRIIFLQHYVKQQSETSATIWNRMNLRELSQEPALALSFLSFTMFQLIAQLSGSSYCPTSIPPRAFSLC